MQRIVVGIDGSEHGRRAARWARDLARPIGAQVHLVHAFRPPEMLYAYGMIGEPALPSDEVAHEARLAAERLVAEVQEELGATEPDLDVTATIEQDDPASALLRAAEDADLIVVGTRGFGSFRGLVLGSVGQKLVAHAEVPVTVVPAPTEE